MTDIRWGMIGCGDVTERKSGPAFSLIPHSRLAGVQSRTLARAQDYAQRHDVDQVFETAEALVTDPAIDAIYIATPPASHPELALMAAAAGKPCCVEKPMANSHAEALRMTEAFERAGVPLFVAYYRRSLPRFRTVLDWIETGEIGAIRHIHWRYSRPPSVSDHTGEAGWRVDPAQAPGGYFDDLAVHGLDLLDFLVGPIRSASGQTAHQHRLYQAPSAFAASWSHENGATATGYWNFASFVREDQVRILGSDGVIEFAVFDDAPVVLETEAGTERRDIPNPDPIQLPHVAAMVESLRTGAAHPSTGYSAARTAWVCDRILG